MSKQTDCFCGSGSSFEHCCEPFHQGEKLPQTALELMRSRYAAYVVCDVNYILETTIPRFRKYYSAKSILEWATSSTWLGLEIVSFSENRVKFIATFLDEEKHLVQHKEDSTFKKLGDRWYFVDGNSF